ncbi:MAG: type II toxin-antitoxin system PemK/MazF family toxin [Rhodothermia bacterium]|nr:type II toxin-antitoxin system PemK/MazF family toxin [Rhodothermia bacterium]
MLGERRIQMLGTIYKQREVVLVPFPYSDLSATKRRPVLIVSNNDYNNSFPDILVCVITSNRFEDEYSVNLDNEDLEIGILPESSVVKMHKLFTIEKTKIIRKFSMVKSEYYDQIKDKIEALIQKS